MAIKTIKCEFIEASYHAKAIAVAAAMTALLLGASIGTQNAYAVYKLPNYKVAVSNPSTSGCTYSGTNFQCVTKNVDGNAETWVKDDRAGAHWAQVYHEMNPMSPGTPSAGFQVTQDGSGNNCIQFRSYLDGKVSITRNGKTAETRYGGNVFKYVTGSGWQLQNYFYAAKTTDGTYTLSNIYVSWTKWSIPTGDWTMGSLFESLVDGGLFGGGSAAHADAYDLDKYWKSNQLEMLPSFCF